MQLVGFGSSGALSALVLCRLRVRFGSPCNIRRRSGPKGMEPRGNHWTRSTRPLGSKTTITKNFMKLYPIVAE